MSAPDGRVVVTTDVLVEGRHFRRDWGSGEDTGRRAAAANLADIVAMGAVPTGIVVGLACPAELEIAWVEAFSDGLRDECALVGASVIGGDISRSDAIFISVTAFGDLEERAPVLRGGAGVGDVVALCGRTGYAAAGLAILSRGFRAGKAFIDAYRRPEPPYAEGKSAALAGATSMCDVSDGLIQDLGHIAAASGVQIDLQRAAFDVPSRMVEIGSALGQDPLGWVLGGGDDHALVATFPSSGSVPDGWQVVGTTLRAADRDDAPPVTIDGEAPTMAGWNHF
ncbi:thiamine-phosphate kinase [Antricoccus suffuscus]|uniref:Thiamine-monophosphate kinase n=2 Tax=Antricoccus suffuscus TaxID=1629062 RepID=A0A2T1A4G4_9ACTN|nr:thiamine-phosphate kinase [Antricoccus suffuscus]